MNEDKAKQALESMIRKVSELFYNGKPFKIFGDAYEIVPELKVEEDHTPNGNLAALGERTMGVQVTRGLLNLPDNAVKFALGHELGHGFSEAALNFIGMHGVSGCVTEVIADLGSAYLLSRLNVEWEDIEKTAAAGVGNIFDRNWSGDHPPGEMRKHCVVSLAVLMKEGASFQEAAKAICMSMLGAKKLS
jgi:hypothetical protein